MTSARRVKVRVARHFGHSTDRIPVSVICFTSISITWPEKTHLAVFPAGTDSPTGSRWAARSILCAELVCIGGGPEDSSSIPSPCGGGEERVTETCLISPTIDKIKH